MGMEKAFLKVAGVPMIEHIIRVLRIVVDQTIIVTNSPAAYEAYDAVIVTDALVKRGPLTGIYSGLLASKDEYNFIVACDMPYLNQHLIAYLSGLAEGYDIVMPKINDLLEPLHAIYSRRLLPLIENRIRQDQLRIRGLFGDARVLYVPEEDIDRYDPSRRSFINLNTPQEYYKEATCSDLECRS
jgi:molybdopterin-guanine dinucleotide biosynthesis protein A